MRAVYSKASYNSTTAMWEQSITGYEGDDGVLYGTHDPYVHKASSIEDLPSPNATGTGGPSLPFEPTTTLAGTAMTGAGAAVSAIVDATLKYGGSAHPLARTAHVG